MLAETAQNPIVHGALAAVLILTVAAASPIAAALFLFALGVSSSAHEPHAGRPDEHRSHPLTFPYLVEAEAGGWHLPEAQLVVTFARRRRVGRVEARDTKLGPSDGGGRGARAGGSRRGPRVAGAHLIARLAQPVDDPGDAGDARVGVLAGAAHPASGTAVPTVLRQTGSPDHVGFGLAEVVEAVTAPSGERYVTLAFPPSEARAVCDGLGIGPNSVVGDEAPGMGVGECSP